MEDKYDSITTKSGEEPISSVILKVPIITEGSACSGIITVKTEAYMGREQYVPEYIAFLNNRGVSI